MNSIPEFLKKSVECNPKKTAIITQDQKYSYEEIDQMSSSVAQNLSNYPKNSVVSMMLENSIEFIITYLGILKSANIAHIIPPNISKTNLSNQIASAEPKCVISSKQYLIKLDEPKFNLDKLDITKISSEKNFDEKKINSNDFAYLIYTSGTTGKPKGIAITHANVLFSTKNIVDKLEYKKTDREILPLSLSHSFGLGCLHTGLYVGSTIILHKNSTNIENILNSISEYHATTLAAVPATLSKMVENYYGNTKLDCENLRLIITNTTTISENIIKKIMGVLKTGKIATYYGLTEASRSTFMVFDEKLGKYNSVGLPASNIEIKIESSDDLEKNGEICIKGPNVIESYWENEEMDRNIENGWLKTSDIGHLDEEGYLYLNGRIDDMINVGGEKVIPSEIEMVVNELEGIEEAVAVGIPHNTFGQVVKLFAKKNNESKIQESEIIGYCVKKLERYKVPVSIQFVDEFPRTEYGKIKRYKLKDLR